MTLRRVIKLMLLANIAGAASSWFYAQLALQLMPHLGFGRVWVGISAVLVSIFVSTLFAFMVFGRWDRSNARVVEKVPTDTYC